jgi:hypothetical protein
MPRKHSFSFTLILLLLGVTGFAFGQAMPWSIRVQQGQNLQDLASGGTINMNADAVGLSTAATLSFTYTGTSTTVNFVSVQYSGALDFSYTGLPDSTVNIEPNLAMGMTITFRPTTRDKLYGKLVVTYTEGKTNVPITINLAGTAPDFAFSYTPQGGNATLLAPGGLITLPAVAIDATSSASVSIINRGSGTGMVNAITATGQNFQLAGLPLPATNVEAGKSLQFNVVYTPKQVDALLGAVAIELVDRKINFNLTGSGLLASYAYEVVSKGGVSALVPGQAIAFPDTNTGETSNVTVRVRNTGNTPGTVSNISVMGTGYQITDSPIVPLTLNPGDSATVVVAFNPTLSGAVTAKLRIGADLFDLSGTGLAAAMNYYFETAGVSSEVQNNGSVIFQPVQVGGTTSVRFLMTNTGNLPATVNSISLGAISTVFTLSGLPSFPVTIAPAATVSFAVAFKPVAAGLSTAQIKVDALTFNLSASANPPAALPDYRFGISSGPVEPLQQPAVSLALAGAYPFALTGTLTLTFNSEVYSTDPAVQFAVGGRSVTFSIPAGQTKAVFQNNDTQIRLQTGSVAGTIVLTPSFVTVDGGVNVTPTNPQTLNLSVAQSAPRLTSVVLSSKTTAAITLQITGYATGRALTQMDFTFTPTSGENVSTSKLTVPVESSFVSWYQGATSQSYGSLFTATITFSFSGNVTNVTNLVDTIQSVSTTITNKLGSSSAVSVSLK